MQALLRQTADAKSIPPPRVLQFGGGNFLRAFLNWMLDELNAKTDFEGSAILIKPTPGGDYGALRGQEGLFHLCLRGLQAGTPVDAFHLVRSIGQVIHPYRSYDRFLDTALLPDLRFVVSNTTEAGIVYREEDRMDDRPALSFPGKLTQWLYHRYRNLSGTPESGCYILPFELLEQNGAKLKAIVLRHAEAWDLEAGFQYWLHEYNHFCNTLVDRIVPGYPEAEADQMRKKLGYDDQCLVLAEPYHLLAIEGCGDMASEFPAGDADLRVIFTDDLSRYRRLKVSILNGAHTAMVPVGLLAGLETVGAVMEDEQVQAFITSLLHEEVVPVLDIDRAEALRYVEDTLDRFRNPFVHHRLADIALNSTAKVEARYLPTLLAYFRSKDRLPHRLTTALAALIRFYGGPWQGKPLPARDTPAAHEHFARAWKASTPQQTAAVALEIWPSLSEEVRDLLIPELADRLKTIEEDGMRALLKD